MRRILCSLEIMWSQRNHGLRDGCIYFALVSIPSDTCRLYQSSGAATTLINLIKPSKERPEICQKICFTLNCASCQNQPKLPIGAYTDHSQGSHFFGLTKFHDISMIFPGFLVNFQVIFSLFLKYDFQVVLNINMQTDRVSFEQKINHFNYTPN